MQRLHVKSGRGGTMAHGNATAEGTSCRTGTPDNLADSSSALGTCLQGQSLFREACLEAEVWKLVVECSELARRNTTLGSPSRMNDSCPLLEPRAIIFVVSPPCALCLLLYISRTAVSRGRLIECCL